MLFFAKKYKCKECGMPLYMKGKQAGMEDLIELGKEKYLKKFPYSKSYSCIVEKSLHTTARGPLQKGAIPLCCGTCSSNPETLAKWARKHGW